MPNIKRFVGYVAPEVIKRAEQPRKQKDRVMNTVASDRLHTYTNAVDIWSLGRTLQALVLDVPSGTLSQSVKTVPVNKEPALCLIDRMMEENPRRRPTAAECLKDPWMAISISSNSLLAKKRERSPPYPAPSPGQPFQRSSRVAFEECLETYRSSPTHSLRKDERPFCS